MRGSPLFTIQGPGLEWHPARAMNGSLGRTLRYA
ncbi:hypothetical protein DEDE109153_12370 [Deinococcus deserti]